MTEFTWYVYIMISIQVLILVLMGVSLYKLYKQHKVRNNRRKFKLVKGDKD
jgi:Na+/H+ antiporter NhaD/arsenite permease-like protein